MSRFVCLMYHDVCRAAGQGQSHGLSPSIRSYSVTTDLLRQHLAEIGSERWMDPANLRSPARVTAPEPRPRVLLTFDDGWAGSFEEAGPLLKEAGARAFVFVTTGLLGHPLFVSESSLRKSPQELFEIGAHTVSHPFLAECSTEVMRRELSDSRRRLEDLLGRKVDTVSIPNGSVNERVLATAMECGYSLVFTSETKVNASGGNVIGRVAVRSDSTPDQIGHWCDGKLGGAGWRQRVIEIPKRVLGPGRYRQMRRWALGERSGEDDMQELVAKHSRCVQ